MPRKATPPPTDSAPAAPGGPPAAKLTPAMAQYHAQKQQVGEDVILLFRIGDFYETFYDDAKRLASLLNLTLTSRDKASDNPVPLAGIPYHALDSYLRRLVRQGVRVAISEQMEDPRQAKGVVQRDIVRIVTPGTLTDDNLLDARRGNYLLAVAAPAARRTGGRERGQGRRDAAAPADASVAEGPRLADRADAPAGLAWLDLSTGEFLVQTLTLGELVEALLRIGPAEVVVADDTDPDVLAVLADEQQRVARRPAEHFHPATAAQALREQFGVATLAGFDLDDETDPAVAAAGAVVAYARETQRGALAHVVQVRRYDPGQHVRLDATTLRALEISTTQRGATRDGSLLAALDRTRTAAGARMLADWLLAPLRDRVAIEARHDALSAWLARRDLLATFRTELGHVADLQRILARLALARSGPRDLLALARTLTALPALVAALDGVLVPAPAPLLEQHKAALLGLDDLADLLAKAIQPEPAANLRDGGVMANGFDPELDRLRALVSDASKWLADYQARLVAETGITALKVGYNQVFGYYIEVRHRDAARVPATLTRKQTVRDAERYVTPELQRHQEEVLSAGEKIVQREQELFAQVCRSVLARQASLQRAATALATLDVLAALAELARERRYVRPEMVDEPVLHIVDGAHPVLEQRMGERFVPNDVKLEGTATPGAAGDGTPIGPDSLMLITGPNMAGKSTYIRQCALLALMAHAGSCLPAKSATIGLVDRIMARVGAADDIARGASTFMVEMSEAAYILHAATHRSLVILDELGRGTSTFDGLSLAWAIAEHLAGKVGCRTLFATHYHELTELANQVPGVFNTHVAIREWADKVVFVHRVVAGPTDRSYGLHVARLAGLPEGVLARAKSILGVLEKSGGREATRRPLRSVSRHRDLPGQLALMLSPEQQLADDLRGLDLAGLDGEAARAFLARWKERLDTP